MCFCIIYDRYLSNWFVDFKVLYKRRCGLINLSLFLYLVFPENSFHVASQVLKLYVVPLFCWWLDFFIGMYHLKWQGLFNYIGFLILSQILRWQIQYEIEHRINSVYIWSNHNIEHIKNIKYYFECDVYASHLYF
jgi:hypothetical protein